MEEPKCPVNNFGKGKKYIVPQTDEALAWYDRAWAEWEENNPDDPTGEKAMTDWEGSLEETKLPRIQPREPVEMQMRARPSPSSYPTVEPGDDEKAMYRMYLSKSLHTEFKKRCAREGRKMSPVINQMLHEYLNR